jgi:hypothetical protein
MLNAYQNRFYNPPPRDANDKSNEDFESLEAQDGLGGSLDPIEDYSYEDGPLLTADNDPGDIVARIVEKLLDEEKANKENKDFEP